MTDEDKEYATGRNARFTKLTFLSLRISILYVTHRVYSCLIL